MFLFSCQTDRYVTSREAISPLCSVQQIDVSFLCVCPVIDHEFRHHIVKVAVDPRGIAEWIRRLL